MASGAHVAGSSDPRAPDIADLEALVGFTCRYTAGLRHIESTAVPQPLLHDPLAGLLAGERGLQLAQQELEGLVAAQVRLKCGTVRGRAGAPSQPPVARTPRTCCSGLHKSSLVFAPGCRGSLPRPCALRPILLSGTTPGYRAAMPVPCYPPATQSLRGLRGPHTRAVREAIPAMHTHLKLHSCARPLTQGPGKHLRVPARSRLIDDIVARELPGLEAAGVAAAAAAAAEAGAGAAQSGAGG